MNQHIKKVYVPMTETAFFILLCLRKPNHGYGIVQMVEKLTEGAIKLTPGTLYGSLSKMEKDNIIHFVREEDKRKIYQITDLGLEVLQLELKRIERLYKIAQRIPADNRLSSDFQNGKFAPVYQFSHSVPTDTRTFRCFFDS